MRNFNGESITDNELKEILRSAYAAPVGRAMYDTLHLTVVSNKDVLTAWEAHMAKAVGNPDLHPFYGAPTVILVSSAMSSASVNNVAFSNAAIVVHNMAIAATELGVGACHIWGAAGMLNGNAEMMTALHIPEGMVPCCAIALGHFDGTYTLRELAEGRIQTDHVR
ncbi:MAG: nitroreductase family protein [Clostridia bacterium]|nr:nitroreductase family protein [Clostridia bacterium]